MPELPEVEFAREHLSLWLSGERLVRVVAQKTRISRGSSSAALRRLSGHEVLGIERRGKWLLWRLSGGLGLLAHLGMTGKFEIQRPGEEDVRWSRASFTRGSDLAVIHYRDPRMFGRLRPGPFAELLASRELVELGPDAWNEPFEPAELLSLLSTKKKTIKEVLMDQTVMAGIGNIHATEALFGARISPLRPACSLRREEVKRLLGAIRRSLARGMALNRGDKIEYVEENRARNPFRIYGRGGDPCPRCGNVLEKVAIGGRGSAFCALCQK
jgi:formamidopyrimidine-DNA glycosylase